MTSAIPCFKKNEIKAVIHRLRESPEALHVRTSIGEWAIVYAKTLPYPERLGHLLLYHRPGGPYYHDQHQIEMTDYRRARGLQRLLRYVYEHDVDYRGGDPDTFVCDWIDARQLLTEIDPDEYARCWQDWSEARLEYIADDRAAEIAMVEDDRAWLQAAADQWARSLDVYAPGDQDGRAGVGTLRQYIAESLDPRLQWLRSGEEDDED